MRRRLGITLILLALATLTLGGTRSSLAAEIRTFADDFSNQSYSADDGSHPWATPWTEAPTQDGSNKGNIQISKSGSACDSRCLVIDLENGPDFMISRTADVSGASSVRLDFSYRTDGEDNEAARVLLTVHSGSSNRTLWTFPLSDEDPAMLAASFDITGYAGPETMIRFSISGTGTTDSALHIDDIVIAASFDDLPPATTTPATTTTTTLGTTTTTSTTTTTLGPTTTTTSPSTTSTTTTGPVTTPTTAAPDNEGTATTTTTTIIIPPTQTKDFATEKTVLVSSSGDAVSAVMQPMETMTTGNSPQSISTVRFVNAAESVRSTAIYGLGIGLLLAGFLIIGFEDEVEGNQRSDRSRLGKGETPRNLSRSLDP